MDGGAPSCFPFVIMKSRSPLLGLRLSSIPVVAVLAVAALAAACGDSTGSGGGVGGQATGAGGEGAGGSPSTGGAPTGGGPTGGGGAEEGGGGATCETSLPIADIATFPNLLSETGLYEDIATDTIASYIRPFQPKYPLWSDAAVKSRFAYIPECGAQIDTSDMDTWQMPVGSRFWKQFVRDGVKVETRVIIRTGPQDIDFRFGTYVWNEDGSDAVLTDDGAQNVNGTGHDVPPKTLCAGCHHKQWRVLGFSAIQLTHDLPGETMASLSDEGLLTVPNPDGVLVPGDSVVEPALGYLHANCGNCHFDGGVTNLSLRMRILSSMTTPEETDTYQTTIGQPTQMFSCNGCSIVAPHDTANSAMHIRISNRDGDQMPPFATEIVDDAGVATIDAWIDSLP